MQPAGTTMQQDPATLKGRNPRFMELYQASPARLVAEKENEIVRRQLELRNKRSSKAQSQRAVSTNSPPTRGASPYCAYRCIKKGTKPYRTPSNGQYRECSHDHYEMPPSEWASTPAEAEWDYSLPNGGWHQRKRVVRFVEPVVTEVYKVERWIREAYGRLVPMTFKEMIEVCEERDEEHERMEEWDVAADEAMKDAMKAWEEGEDEDEQDKEEEDEGDEGVGWVVVEDDCMVLD
ncbi:hypothetical protein OEA41_000700 [Lepraria neglecta]|uniref:Uncharacterized protein n=1 Tax=Lepraria neglecta TaxID=209136 RepID=A0AAD9ZH32_9LECA|nr:hypothetical protein OEA41_000700 [Lepraria neglecta]